MADSQGIPPNNNTPNEPQQHCAGCNKLITDADGGNLINFSDAYFHSGCFNCNNCRTPIDYENSVVLVGEDGKAICVNCSYKCKGCGNPILEEAITTGNDTYHTHCFNCSSCARPIQDLRFFHINGRLLCPSCHTETRASARSSVQSVASPRVKDAVQTLPDKAAPAIASNNATATANAGQGLKRDPSNNSYVSALTEQPGISSNEYVMQLEHELEERSRQLSACETTLDYIKTTSRKAVEEFHTLQSLHTAEVLKRQQLESTVAKLQEQLDNMARADAARERAEETLEALNTQIEGMRRERESLRVAIEEEGRRRDELEMDVGRLVFEKHAAKASAGGGGDADDLTRELQALHTRFTNTLSTLHADRAHLRSDIATLESTREHLTDGISHLTEENTVLTARQTRITGELIDSAEMLDKVESHASLFSPNAAAAFPEMEELRKTVEEGAEGADRVGMMGAPVKAAPLPPPRIARPRGPRKGSVDILSHAAYYPPAAAPAGGMMQRSASGEPTPTITPHTQQQQQHKKDKWTKEWKTNLKATTTKLKKAMPQAGGSSSSSSTNKPLSASGTLGSTDHLDSPPASSSSPGGYGFPGSAMFKLGAKKASSKSDVDLSRPTGGSFTYPSGAGGGPHAFRTHAYRSPRKCDLCDEKLWGKELRCERCGYHCHQKCVPSIIQHCPAGSGGDTHADGSTPTAGEGKVFGVALTRTVEAEGGVVPRVVGECIAAVEMRGMTYEGIYRKSGPLTQTNKIIACLDRGDYTILSSPDSAEDSEVDIAAVTSALKQYFRELPEPLLGAGLYGEWVGVVKRTEDDEERLKAFIELLKKLPPAHLSTLAYLILHLHRIQLHAPENLMNTTNLGVVFGPSLLRPPHAETQLDFAESAAKNAVVEVLIRFARLLFEVPREQPEQSGSGIHELRGRSDAEMGSATDLAGNARDEDNDAGEDAHPSRPHSLHETTSSSVDYDALTTAAGSEEDLGGEQVAGAPRLSVEVGPSGGVGAV
ncbi:uncharacterized protein EV422DRAFT_571553 [Fimicolochytrium jonesii]|uniref:uncharacterized protein n=1 Tax=Fimicolochytrium jonesii TaxID=1396493 RepID=UPI0022FF3C19|nr:uncharacterized protein EV422DRAFT_571553 [Fimicolochytrium jonesii]KAI8816582.1 hypothetical protein EV422DRAFT_571553 [Fimicolochytrium jonesii]